MSHQAFEAIGDHIAEREGYVGLQGMKAIHRYLIEKFRWQPEEVRKLSAEDLELLLAGYEEKSTTDWN